MASLTRKPFTGKPPSLSGVTTSTEAGQSLAALAQAFAERLLCFFLPIATLVFYLKGPHEWQIALLWTLPVWTCVVADLFSPAARNELPRLEPNWPYETTLYLLTALQLANIWLMLDGVNQLGWNSPGEIGSSLANLFTVRILTGTTSCCSGIAVAHELIHRRSPYQRWMGRLLLWTVCYDHFAVEHIRGHHRRVGTPADPATARYDETYSDFWWRTLKGQFVSAWRLENERLQNNSNVSRVSRHRVLHGIVIQATLIGLTFAGFGVIAGLMFLYQAFYALRLLEAVNYFQHWGLSRTGRHFGGPDAWATDSWFTLHSFVGLSRHADHHEYGRKPYHRLAYQDEGPRLPYGYFAMYVVVKFFNDRYRSLARRELQARGLGPFRGGTPSVLSE